MAKPELKQCPNMNAPYLYTDIADESKRLIIKARCKLWSCPYCSKVNAHQHRIRILNGINELRNKGHEFSFVTVTSHEKLRSTDACLAIWRKAWKRLRERLRRFLKANGQDDLVFVITTEFHKDGRLHWHILINTSLGSRWWKDNSRSVGLGYQCKSIKMDSAIQATNYLSKYLSKGLATASFPRKMRRIVYSQNFPNKPSLTTAYEWKVLDAKTSLVEMIEEAWRKRLDPYLNGVWIQEIVYDMSYI